MSKETDQIQILRLLFKFHTEYIGIPDYISGNALRHAISQQINTSIGIFTNQSHLFKPIDFDYYFKIWQEKAFLKPYYNTDWDKYSNSKTIRCFFRPSYATFDVINPPENILNIIREREIIQLGGGRNRGYGLVSLKDWLWINPNNFEYPEDATHITLISPMKKIPKFVHEYDYRWNYEIFWNHGKKRKPR
ncbi:MAG: hypothetical protein GF329_11585 [Candidatus Lokiarchaeota archaeon]|nr:hypothetical protein [Candidatus Lokiarchaeota archaeon]